MVNMAEVYKTLTRPMLNIRTDVRSYIQSQNSELKLFDFSNHSRVPSSPLLTFPLSLGISLSALPICGIPACEHLIDFLCPRITIDKRLALSLSTDEIVVFMIPALC